MPLHNTAQHYGWVARLFHWMTALLILSAIPLGLYANNLPYDTAEALAWKAQVFSVHKTLGLAAFLIALLRILWALTGEHPVPLHPDRKLELFAARLVHWMLYIAMLVVPLSGWVHHAAVTGFAPILWPFGQDLPFVPKSESLGSLAAGLHWIFTKLLAAAIILHVAGALKHHLLDRDATLRRMTRGDLAPAQVIAPRQTLVPGLAAVLLFALAGAIMALPQPKGGEAATATSAPAATGAGNWQVEDGTLAITVTQMGQTVTGSFATWAAEIQFDETATAGQHGTVTATVDTGSLSLGSVSDQATGPEFLNSAAFPQATFAARILADGASYVARGDLTLRGVTVPLDLPFSLTVQGDRATMDGRAQLDRRSFGMGQSYGDESSVGFGVALAISLTATRTQ